MRRLALVLALFTTQCSWCAVPKPAAEDDDKDRDAAPHDLAGKPRCETRATIALPGALELGRVASMGAAAPDQARGVRVLVGARRGARAGVLEVDGVTARFVDTAAAVGDAPPPLPVVSGDKIFVVAYEGAAGHPHLALRDVAAPARAVVELPPEPPDESFAYDAVARLDGSIAVAWDGPAPSAAKPGGAIFATIVRGGAAAAAVRLSPADVDADAPRLVSLGPTLLAMWIAHRALPGEPDADAAPAPERAGEDLDRAWIELLPFDDALRASAPLRHVTPDTGRVNLFDVVSRGGNLLDVIARDAIEPAPGQGGSAVLVRLAGPAMEAPVVLASGVGRGLPFIASDFVLFDDPNDAGRAATGRVVPATPAPPGAAGGPAGPLGPAPGEVAAPAAAGQVTLTPEPALDGARALASLPGGDVLVAAEGGVDGTKELRVVRCRK